MSDEGRGMEDEDTRHVDMSGVRPEDPLKPELFL